MFNSYKFRTQLQYFVGFFSRMQSCNKTYLSVRVHPFFVPFFLNTRLCVILQQYVCQSVRPLYVNAQSYQLKNSLAVFWRLFSLEHCRVIDKKIKSVRSSDRPRAVYPFCINIRLRVILQQCNCPFIRLLSNAMNLPKVINFKNLVTVFWQPSSRIQTCDKTYLTIRCWMFVILSVHC